MKRAIIWAAVAVGILAVGAVALALLFDANRFRPTLESALHDALHREVKLGNLSLSLLSGSVEANDLEIGEDPAFGKVPFLRAKAIRVGVELWPLIFSKQLNVTGITIEKPEIMLMQTPDSTGITPALERNHRLPQNPPLHRLQQRSCSAFGG